MRKVSETVVEKIKTHVFLSVIIFQKIRAVNDIMWKNYYCRSDHRWRYVSYAWHAG